MIRAKHVGPSSHSCVPTWTLDAPQSMCWYIVVTVRYATTAYDLFAMGSQSNVMLSDIPQGCRETVAATYTP